jgi:hypothetical protein
MTRIGLSTELRPRSPPTIRKSKRTPQARDAQAYRDGTLGHRARIRLQASEYFDDLLLLHDLDRRGRVRGAFACQLDDAIECIREMDQENRSESRTIGRS